MCREGEEEDVSCYWMNFRERRILGNERGSTTRHCVENSLWKRLWICRTAHYKMNDTNRRDTGKGQMLRTYSRTTYNKSR